MGLVGWLTKSLWHRSIDCAKARGRKAQKSMVKLGQLFIDAGGPASQVALPNDDIAHHHYTTRARQRLLGSGARALGEILLRQSVTCIFSDLRPTNIALFCIAEIGWPGFGLEQRDFCLLSMMMPILCWIWYLPDWQQPKAYWKCDVSDAVGWFGKIKGVVMLIIIV